MIDLEFITLQFKVTQAADALSVIAPHNISN